MSIPVSHKLLIFELKFKIRESFFLESIYTVQLRKKPLLFNSDYGLLLVFKKNKQ